MHLITLGHLPHNEINVPATELLENTEPHDIFYSGDMAAVVLSMPPLVLPAVVVYPGVVGGVVPG